MAISTAVLDTVVVALDTVVEVDTKLFEDALTIEIVYQTKNISQYTSA